MVLRIGFVPGVMPDKWARRWAERERERIELLPLPEEEQASALLGSDPVAEMVLARLPLGGAADLSDRCHQVRLYDEQPVVVAAADHPVAAYERVPAEDLEHEQFPLGVPEQITARAEQLPFGPMTVRDAIEVAASGTGVVICPQSVTRLHHRKDVVHRPVDGLPASTVALVWLRERDGERLQRFVGVVRGRGARSSR